MAYFVRLLLLLACLQPNSVVAQTDDQLNRAAREIFETVLSPYCPGRTISNCPSPDADQLRTAIRQQLESGESPEEVKEELYATFGDELRTIPRARGFGLLAWIVPGLAFLFGAWAILVWVRRTNAASTEAAQSESARIEPDADAKIAAEMAELDSLR